ncbi:hypothetical protein DXG03_006425 [Asterophora parasitica]|uniref:Uncharacterized protein n=1 Tax=Asterophora parasitica TaxID=117018 RepID=A0A9P7GAW1_9AGAR|nr:hypothetical protein DXG03_006425 [Asterophora parasitica]
MLVLSALHTFLSQVLSLPELHTAVLLTPAGQLVSVAADPLRPKDEIRVVVGLAAEVWQETRGEELSMVDSEFGRILVVPVEETPASTSPVAPTLENGNGITNANTGDTEAAKEGEPLMLLALNSSSTVDWDVLQSKGKILACHLAKPLGQFKEYLAVPRPVLPASTTTSPPPRL